MSCPECLESRQRASEQARLRSEYQRQAGSHVTRTENAPAPPQRPTTSLPTGPGLIRRG